MKVAIEKNSGFCFGVENAIKLTEEALKTGDRIYSLGHIVHNEAEVKRLEALGLITITHEEFRKLRDSKVVIRAHGEPPETYALARENNIELIEATCPIVKNIQKKIRRHHENHGQAVQSIVYGKSEHAEVIGLLGQTGGHSILISGTEDIQQIDLSKPSEIYSQTTRSRESYADIIKEIRKAYANEGHDPDKMLKVNNTICGKVANREPFLRKFCGEYDVIVFVSGKNSSNGRMLYNICLEKNDNTHFISDASEIEEEWFVNMSSAGVSGATSTPRWLIREVAERIIMITENRNK